MPQVHIVFRRRWLANRSAVDRQPIRETDASCVASLAATRHSHRYLIILLLSTSFSIDAAPSLCLPPPSQLPSLFSFPLHCHRPIAFSFPSPPSPLPLLSFCLLFPLHRQHSFPSPSSKFSHLTLFSFFLTPHCRALWGMVAHW